MDGGGKKRPRVDLLASLDAAFAAKKSAPASKYTSQAAAQVAAANSQQAYLHTKHKKKKGGVNGANGSNKSSQQQQQHNANNNGNKQANINGNKQANGNSNNRSKPPSQPVDPLYSKLHVGILSVGLKNCSLVRRSIDRYNSSLYCIRPIAS